MAGDVGLCVIGNLDDMIARVLAELVGTALAVGIDCMSEGAGLQVKDFDSAGTGPRSVSGPNLAMVGGDERAVGSRGIVIAGEAHEGARTELFNKRVGAGIDDI